MNIDLEVLKEINSTAIKAAGMRDYDMSPLKKLHVRPDGAKYEIDIEPPPPINEVYDLETVVQICEAYHTGDPQAPPEVFVGREEITVVKDSTRVNGYSRCPLTVSWAILAIREHHAKPMSPENFERLACLIFGADEQFINRLRKLQWKVSSDAKATIANVSKSADITHITRVLDENGVLFQDVSLFVRTPVFVLPYETKEVEIELQISANAETETIAFAPVPGQMERALLTAMREIQEELRHMLDEHGQPANVLLGKPILKRKE